MIINGFYFNTNVSLYVLTNLHQTDLCDVDGTYMNLCSFKLNRVYVVSSNLAVFFAGVEVFKLYSGLKREKGNSSSCIRFLHESLCEESSLNEAYVTSTYRKIPKISPGAFIFQRPVLRGLFLEVLIFGGAYLRREICVSKSTGLAL